MKASFAFIQSQDPCLKGTYIQTESTAHENAMFIGTIGIAFLAGLASFLSPCVLPLVPIYLAQLVGPSIYQAGTPQKELRTRFITFLHALTFVVGFTLAFVALGATASTLGSFLKAHQILLRQVGGVLLVLIGLHFTGLLKLPFLYWQKHFAYYPGRPSYPASLLIGIIFAIGWSPCIGPILGSILFMAENAATLRSGVLLLLTYYIHSPIDVHFGRLRKVLVDNRFHRIHHSIEPRHFKHTAPEPPHRNRPRPGRRGAHARRRGSRPAAQSQ